MTSEKRNKMTGENSHYLKGKRKKVLHRVRSSNNHTKSTKKNKGRKLCLDLSRNGDIIFFNWQRPLDSLP